MSGPAHQEIFEIATRGRGIVEITREVAAMVLRSRIHAGVVHVFCRHTSASLVLMENADPTARRDLEDYVSRLAPDGDPRYEHSAEGPDDMSAHLRMVLTRSSETMPIADGRMLLGTWQGLFLWEHRLVPHRRSLVVTILAGADRPA